MNQGHVVAIVSLVVLAAAHSYLGEVKLLGPLLAQPLPPLGVSDRFARPVLRFAWHLTSVAWLGLAGALVVAPTSALVVGATLAVSGLITHLASKGRHFAWAVFLTGALGAGAEILGRGRLVISLAGAATAAALAGLHIAWAAGMRWGLHAAIPQVGGRPARSPGRVMTLLVAGALLVLALLFLALGRLVVVPATSPLALAAAIVFGLRTVGDLRTVGLFKRGVTGTFARNDTLYYTPLCFAIAAALLWLR